MKKNKIAIIGHFGGKENFYDGQTIKTKILYEELAKATDWKIKKVDTYYKRKNPLKLLIQTLAAGFTCKDIVVLLSKNGMRVFFPILYAFTKIFKTRVYHSLIGGNLANYVKKYPKFKKYLESFRVNWVETVSIKNALESVGVTNVEVVPNFKRLNVVPAQNLTTEFTPPYRFCTFSRVMKEKGIEDAIETVEAINEENGKVVCELDIYGNIDCGYTQRFEEIMKTASPAVRSRGVVPFDKSVDIIKDYYALLFPTFWVGEGFAGTIVDALSAGLPVIATDWNCNGEIVENMVTGILYPNDRFSCLKDAVVWMIQNPDAVAEMKKQCVKSAECYQPDAYIKKMVSVIENN